MLIFATLGTTQTNTIVKFRDAVTHGIVSVGVGSPLTQYSLMLESASVNTWVGAGKSYVPTSTSAKSGQTISVEMNASIVTLDPGLVVTDQSIGVASSSYGFTDLDGVLGLGPIDSSVGTLSPDPTVKIPTVTDNLFSQGTIGAHEIGISAQPSTADGDENGEIMFGGDITYVSITSTSPASEYWGLDASFSYGTSGTPILSSTAGIIDHASALLLLATDAFQSFKEATGGFVVGGTTFEITPNALIWPRAFNVMMGGNAGDIYLAVGDIGAHSGQGLDFKIGYSILKRFYTVLDTGNRRIGLATTSFTDATTN
ncbi:MAG: aspartic peptidase domain-containing protein [Podila humilis]|nr:MAG: aspartic peptidase domain-containing protein [Podila humilis]